jgi:hypothetical protein
MSYNYYFVNVIQENKSCIIQVDGAKKVLGLNNVCANIALPPIKFNFQDYSHFYVTVTV